MTQNRYSLSDAEILSINEAIDGSDDLMSIFFNGWKSTWNAILNQEGKSLDDYGPDNPLIPQDYAIPMDQSTDIVERMKNRAVKLGISPISITSVIMLEWANMGPSYYVRDNN